MEKSLIIEVNGVGYLVHTTAPILRKANEKEDMELYVHTRVREDDISLYGFEIIDELDFFKTLISISGVGAKLAMEILSQKMETVKSAIISEDVHFLCKIPGIGKRTADRLIVELKNKVDWDIIAKPHAAMDDEVDEDAINALISLGYQKYEINRVLRRMPDNFNKVEEVVTYFLQNV